ncbi:MAG: hypothetical protein FJ135_10580 [Deltaproteobacteria bacterium]|nr:hypothetical protein [Deltaproteobacteria bacterium]
MKAAVPAEVLQSSLLLENLVLPEALDSCPGPINLTVGLQEFLLIEGLSALEADVLLRTAATLRRPVAGRIYHWGRDLFALPRRSLYPWRKRLAFVSPWQSLLPRLTLLENVTLPLTLATGRSAPELGRQHQALLEQLSLAEYQSSYPGELPARVQHLALWAREMIQQPLLILGVLAGQEEVYGAPVLAPHLLPLLEDYHRQGRGAIVLAGPFLDWAYPVADRRLSCRENGWEERPLPGRRQHPLINYLKVL